MKLEKAINSHDTVATWDWARNILTQAASGSESGAIGTGAKHRRMNLDVLRSLLVEVANVVNDLTTTVPGKVLDARQGKALRILINSVAAGVLWQDQVIAVSNTPPASPSDGDRYIVGTTPTGIWAGHAGDVAVYATDAWVFSTPEDRWGAFVYDDAQFLLFHEGVWTVFADLDRIMEILHEAETARDAILEDAGFIAVSTDLLGSDHIGTVATDLLLGVSSLVKKVADSISNVNIVGGDITNVNAVASNKTNIDAVNANKTNIDAVASNETNINAVNANKLNIDAVVGNSTNINAVALNKVNIDKVATVDAQITTLAPIKDDIVTVAGKKTEVTALGARTTEIDALYAELAQIASKENTANKKTTLADNSDTYFPTQKAVNDALGAIKGVGYTDGSLKTHEDKLATLNSRVNQEVNTTSSPTFAGLTVGTIDTGQGATEVHLMNQNLRKTDNVIFKNIEASEHSYGVAVTASVTFTKASNTISLTGITASLGLEVGDVIQVSGTTSNDNLYTVETASANSIVVNYEHRNGAGSLSLTDETKACTIRRIAKWYNAPLGLGQAWVRLTRSDSTTYTNTTNRSITVLTYPHMSNAQRLSIDGQSIPYQMNTGSVVSYSAITFEYKQSYMCPKIVDSIVWEMR